MENKNSNNYKKGKEENNFYSAKLKKQKNQINNNLLNNENNFEKEKKNESLESLNTLNDDLHFQQQSLSENILEKQNSNLKTENKIELSKLNSNNENIKEKKQANKIERKRKIIRLLITTIILIVVCLAFYLPLKLTGTLDKIDSSEELIALINSGGMWSYAIFFILQFLQATIFPIPAMVTTIAGALVFGPWIASLISFLAIFFASIFMFYLGRKVGKKLINWIVGEEEAKKWEEKLGKGKFVFFLMMLFPIFPDDILCLVVGATTISFRFFLITILIARPIGILTTCFFGSGSLIPFSGWGIPVWIVLIILMAFAFYASIKWQKQIEEFIINLGRKMGIKSKSDKNKMGNNQSLDTLQTNKNVSDNSLECDKNEDINNQENKHNDNKKLNNDKN